MLRVARPWLYMYHSSFPSPERPTADHPQVVLVFFLGGCSYAEISALRFLSQREIGMLPWRYMYTRWGLVTRQVLTHLGGRSNNKCELALIGRRKEKDVGLISREEGGALFQLYVHELLIAKRLSMRLLILQCIFSVGGVWCHTQECN